MDDRHVTLATQHQALLAALAEAKEVPAGRLLGLPELPEADVWVDTAGAAALVRVNPKTITSWLARGGPKKRPFPPPHRFLYRLYWRRSDIEAWLRDEALPATTSLD
ncbi:helix-turn-helix domain-containing protein [Streptomyces sp. SID14478]|uniref:helix-turn-helix transcriptional regulator n=1 Tax=Streptomyces sp. SID14478 TaxID=2706073 RepID=UPI0013DC6FFB|nr:helix-turn-helix domain-containing protein [Streptomyces sp. SID14478]NEB76278.1 helix-turn-helix domain-containing protein [Streptomyces sp. SID14478]